ncbi:MAG: Tat pathway signal protein [Hyphomonas sp.]|nr:Tat pathway signal protein [Hyphomonas sp.]
MWSRREFLIAGGAATSIAALSGCGGSSMNSYERAASAIRAPLPSEPGLLDFVRFATLAPNSHNTQPWKFRLGADAIDILPDFSRRTPAVDPDDHHIFVTLGCAAENLLIAANASGRPADIRVETEETETRIQVSLGHAPARDQELCNAIPARQSTRSDYDGEDVGAEDLTQLRRAASMPGVQAIFLTERPKLEAVLEFIVQGNSAQMDDPAFVRELKSWIRFNAGSAIETGDGLFAKCSGNPALPTWAGRFLFDRVFTKEAENKKYTRQMRSSAGVVVFAAETDGPEGWIQVGRSFERFALQATVLGIRHAHMNMPIEVAELRPAFADWLGMPGRRPNLVIRFGRTAPMPMSMRRPVDDVIV